MKKFFLLSMLALCFVGLTHANLLSNGDFTYGVGGVTGDEMAAMDWTNWNSSPTGWNNRETNANGPYGDTANYHIAIGNAGGYGAGAYQDVSGAAGKTYIFSADASLDAWWKNAGYLKLEFYDGLGTDPENMVGFFESDHFQQPGYDTGLPWANYTIQATAPAGTAVVRAILGTWGEGGTARFDNAVLDLATKASSPVPGNGDVVGSSLDTLAWINPDPNNPADTITSDVYFLDAGPVELTTDPNMGPGTLDAGVVLLVGGTTAEQVSISGLSDDHYYYWAVHCTDPHGDPNGPVTSQGDVWHFYTGDATPVVSAGADQFNWVAKSDGDADPTTYTITVTGTYTDDQKSPIASAEFVNLGWGWDPDGEDNILGNEDDQRGIEKISEVWDQTPGTVHASGTVTAVFKTHYVEGDPAYSTDIPGYWDIQLQVTDGAGMGEDVVYVRVDADCGSAAESDASDSFDGYFDTNNDCIVDVADLADLAGAWLNCNANKLTTCP